MEENKMEKTSFSEIIQFAIEKEVEAMDFYKTLSDTAENEAMKPIFLEWSNQEKKHKELLEKVKMSEVVSGAKAQTIPDLQISDYLVDIQPKPDINYQDALILAMKREEKAYNLYESLEAKTTDSELKNTFNMLKQEEAKHKLKLETEYDEYILKQN
jgi:rubrerythrin